MTTKDAFESEKNTKTAVFLQARMASTRLPNKVLLPLADSTVIEQAMMSLRRIGADVNALLTDEESAAPLQPAADRRGFEVFPGPSEDVLHRYALAARHYGVDRYFRATGDNPLVSYELAISLSEIHARLGADFSGYLGPPLGTGVELVETKALLQADSEAVDPYEREHVSPFIYRRPLRFRILHPCPDDSAILEDARVTLDTEEDYVWIQKIFDALYEGEPISPYALVSWLREQRSDRSCSGQSTHCLCSVGTTR